MGCNDVPGHVAQVVTSCGWGGAQRIINILVCDLLESDTQVTLICGAECGRLVEVVTAQGGEVVVVESLTRGFSPVADLRAINEIRRILRSGDYDLVHTHSTKAGIAGRLGARLAGVGAILHTVHNWGFVNREEFGLHAPLIIGAELVCAQFSDHLVCVAEHLCKTGLRYRIGSTDKYRVVYNGVSATQSNDQTLKLQRKIGSSSPDGAAYQDRAAFSVVMASRFAFPKYPERVIEAAKAIGNQNSEIEIVLAGDGPKMKQCRELISKWKLEDIVRLPGYVEDVSSLLDRADACLLWSEFEGLPIWLVEGMHAGLPAIANRNSAVAEMVDTGMKAIVFEPDSPDALVQAIKELEAKPRLRASMGEQNRAVARRYFSEANMLAEYRRLYASVCKRK